MRWLSRLLLWLAGLLVVLALVGAGGALWFRNRVQASLPPLTGTFATAGVQAPVQVERDARGGVRVRGASRLDVARGLGFAHAQDRFFQMDTLRRAGAGQLAALLGPALVRADERVRRHGVTRTLEAAWTRLPPDQRALLEAYAAGVNAGLASLPSPPWEYTVLRADPEPWRPSDALRVSLAMSFDLLDATADRDRALAALRETTSDAVVAFLAPLIGPEDHALDGTNAPLPPVPGPREIDLRRRGPAPTTAHREASPSFVEPLATGSNNFAVAGGRTAHGAALLAGDPHLGLGAPGTWYRTVLEWTDATGAARRLAGATLPGTPLLAFGTNGHVAWSFTNSYVDTADLVLVELGAGDPRFYAVGDHLQEVDTRTETIAVRGGEPVELHTTWTRWGPIIGHGQRDRPLALRSTVHEPEALDFGLFAIEALTTVEQVLDQAPAWGMPAQNILVGDRAGKVGWTLTGRLPRRVGFDGRLPVPWAYGDRRWDGWLSPAEYPRRLVTGESTLATANQRLVGGDALQLLGDAGYELGHRARRIDAVLATLPATVAPGDLLRVQLDTAAPYLARWRELLLRTLSAAAVDGSPGRAELRRLVVAEPAPGATIESVAYRLVRAWRSAVLARVLEPVWAPAERAFAGVDHGRVNSEAAVWRLLEERPMHWLDPRYADWEALLRGAADEIVADLAAREVPLAEATWGQRNRARLHHPLAGALPGWLPDFATRWLHLPADALPGDHHMPRVQGPRFGASLRLVVAPGDEAAGILELPGGPSGNPLSPFWATDHADWVQGRPTPLLPGPALHTLMLEPAAR